MPPVRVDASGVGLLAADDQAQQGRLAAAVAADHADAFALADADRDAVQDGRRAVGLADRLEVDQVGRHQRLVNARPERPEPVRRRRGTRGTDRTRRVRGRSAARPPRPRPGRRWSGPEPETIEARAPRSRPAARVWRRVGRSDSAAACRSLVSEWASAIVSPARSASSSPSAGCSVEGIAPALPVEFGVALGRRDAEVGEGERPPERPRRQDGCEHLAATGAQRRAADQAERDVAAQRRGQLAEFGARGTGAPQFGAGDEGCRRVGRPAGHSAGDGDHLGDLEPGVRAPPAHVRRAATPPARPGSRRRPEPSWIPGRSPRFRGRTRAGR